MTPSSALTGCVPISLVVGLGNPGAQYLGTRHNIGFTVVDALARRWQVALKSERRFQADYGTGHLFPGRRVHLLKPLTYMNRSGQSLRSAIDWLKLSPQEILVIYDDMDLPVGRLRLRQSGSAGGHNGMKSTIAHLHTQDFSRLRIGIGATRQAENRDQAVVAHVLGSFSKPEQQIMDRVTEVAVKAVEDSCLHGVETAMNHYNGLTIEP
ncbi:MAG: aminoacyl-tRNA hydrolase [Cyanobacteria bacterium REEB459]|nr:aminoacyl-tRNA hydrolase [Cyanobacteria bacterium REEB459]